MSRDDATNFNRIAQFIGDLKLLEIKHGLEIDHHGEFVGYLRDTRVSNNHNPIVATLSNDSDWEGKMSQDDSPKYCWSCPDCGEDNMLEDSFCIHCGYGIEKENVRTNP